MRCEMSVTSGPLTRLREIVKLYPGAFVALSFIATFIVYALVPSETLLDMVGESSLLAVLGVVLVMLCAPETLRVPTRATLIPFLQFGLPVLVVAIIGLLQNVFMLASVEISDSFHTLTRVPFIILFCFTTGVFEEGLFRIVAIGAFMQALTSRRGPLRHPLMVSAFASALLFGLLHASAGFVGALKPVQAALFGLVMAALYAQTRNLWPAALAHALFNFLSMGPYLLIGDHAQSALLFGDTALQVMLVSIALLIPLAGFALRRLGQLERHVIQEPSKEP